jgi:hypothetical protein
MDAQLEAKFIECLDALAQGEPVEHILARYPADAAQLRPLLSTAAGLPALRLEPSEAARTKSRQQFMAQADLLRRTSPRQSLGFLPRFLTGFAAAAVVAVVLGFGAVSASTSALPGDPLYGLKLSLEGARLQSAGSPTQREALQREFDQRRVDEANQLITAGREGEVEFTGRIQVIEPAAWVVSGLVVQIDANTAISGTPQIDRLAAVRGVTGPGGLRATSISIESTGDLGPTVTPEAAATPQATETPAPTRTLTPTTPATLPPSLTPTPAPTSTPRPTISAPPTALPQPTATPVSGGNDNQNSNGDDGNSTDDGNSNDDNGNSNDDNGGGGDNSNDDGSNDDSDDNNNGN